jgi:replicative DNA helicase
MAKIKYWDRLKHQIERGKEGLNTGIPFQGFDSLSDHIKNIQQGRYDLIFAGTSVGKTAFVNSAYVYGAIEFLQNNPGYIHNLEVIYYSLEIPPENQIAKHIAGLIWRDYGILTTLDEILSRGKMSIRPEIEQLIPMYEEQMQEIQDKYLFFRSALNPDYLYKDLMGYAESRGKVIKNKEGIIVEYIPNDPSLITLIVIDHIGLVDLGKYGSLKEAIDKISKSLVFFRNMFNFSPVVVVQINRSSEQMDRRENDNWLPMLSDIKNTGNLSEDCNTAIGLTSPFYYSVDKCLGYDITKYRNRYRVAKVCKNRDGDVNLLVSFLFIGEIGSYTQLPRAEEQIGKPTELKRIDEYYAKQHNKNGNS